MQFIEQSHSFELTGLWGKLIKRYISQVTGLRLKNTTNIFPSLGRRTKMDLCLLRLTLFVPNITFAVGGDGVWGVACRLEEAPWGS